MFGMIAYLNLFRPHLFIYSLVYTQDVLKFKCKTPVPKG